MKNNDPHSREFWAMEAEGRCLSVLTSSAVLAGLYVTSLYSYLLFHSLAELFSIVIAFGIFVIAWNSRPFLNNNYLLFIGISYLFVGGIDMIHTLAYQGMGVFKIKDANHPTQLWIAARSLESISLLAAPFFIGRKFNHRIVFAVYAAIFSLLLWSIFGSDLFPVCYVDGVGLTPFKKDGEYMISFLLLLSGVALLRRKSVFDKRVLSLILLSIAVTIASELAFTFYIGVYDFSNLAGHLFKIVSFYLIYLAIIKTGIRDPFDIIFRSLKQREEELQEAKAGLEARVVERTRDLHISKELLETIFDHTHMMVAYLDSRFNFIRVNRAYAKADGREPDFFPGKNHFSLYPNAENEELFRRVVSTGEPYFAFAKPFEYVEHLERGVSYWDWSLAPIKKPDGEVAGLILTLLNVTDRLRAEEALWESEAKFRSIYAQSPIGIELYDASGRLIDANPACLAMFGVADFKSVAGFELFNDPNLPEAAKAKLLKGEPAKYEVSFDFGLVRQMKLYETSKSGKYYLDCLITPLVSKKDETSGYLVHVRDITERKRTEEALRERDAFIRNILDSVDEVFIVVDREYRILSANRAFCEFVKLPQEKVVGRPCYEVSHHVDKPCYELGEQCAVKRTFESGLPHSVMHIHTTGAGAKRYVEIKSYPIADEAGNIVSAIETINDITERKKLEEQLLQAQKMEAIGTLAGGVAHDFNNILTAIIGYASIMKRKMHPDDPQQASIDQILASSGRAARLTQGLLAFGRKQIINPKPVNLNDIVKSVEKLLRRLIGEDVELITRLADQSLIAMADAGQVEQVLMNLVTNARDAMPEGGLLTITTEECELKEDFVAVHRYGKPGKYALLSVSDTGQGMDEQTRIKIFEPFFTTKEVGKGTGLGLAIVYGIVKQHEGTINVYSEPGKGTTFKVYLPLITSPAEQSQTETAAVPAGGTETILLAEDDHDVRKLTKNVLTDFGYHVIEAVDGQDALEKYAVHAEEIDFLILDVIMPKKSGREVYDAVKSLRPDIDTLFISGYTADIIHKKGIFEEGLQFISKPVGPHELLRSIRKILDKKK